MHQFFCVAENIEKSEVIMKSEINTVVTMLLYGCTLYILLITDQLATKLTNSGNPLILNASCESKYGIQPIPTVLNVNKSLESRTGTVQPFPS